MSGKRHNLERLLQSAYDFQKRQKALNMAQSIKETGTKNTLPWYERGLFWGFLSLAVAIVLTVVAAMQRDLRWLLFIAWPCFVIPFWLMCREIRRVPIKWISFSILSVCAAVGLVAIGRTAPKPAPTVTTTQNESKLSQPDLSGIQKSLDEINRNLARTGRPQISATQMEAIRELDQFIVGRDEMDLRQAFGFPLMMEKNIRMNITIVSHLKRGTPREITKNLIGHETIVDSELAEGRIRRWGGSFLIDQFDGTRVYALMLPEEYSSGKKQLLKFETSSELPAPAIKAVKNFDDVVYKNADKLLHVLNDALRKDPDYYLRYDDPSSPIYFHQLDAMWLDNFIQLRPEADKIRDAIRQFLDAGKHEQQERAIQPVKDPLEVVAFRSDYGISIANNEPHSVHVMSLLVKGSLETKSFAFGLDIAPGKISKEKIHEEGIPHVRTLRKLADTWEDHVKKARELYLVCGMQWTFFSASDVSLQQIKDGYTRQNLVLGYKDISGVLYYRVEGSNKTEEQVVPIAETITVNNDTCPKL